MMRLTPAQLSALLEGLDWARVRGVRTVAEGGLVITIICGRRLIV